MMTTTTMMIGHLLHRPTVVAIYSFLFCNSLFQKEKLGLGLIHYAFYFNMSPFINSLIRYLISYLVIVQYQRAKRKVVLRDVILLLFPLIFRPPLARSPSPPSAVVPALKRLCIIIHDVRDNSDTKTTELLESR